MVSPSGSDICFGPERDDKIRPTTSDREQGNSETSSTQTPEGHVFGVEGDASVLESVVGSHCLQYSYSVERGDDGLVSHPGTYLYLYSLQSICICGSVWRRQVRSFLPCERSRRLPRRGCLL